MDKKIIKSTVLGEQYYSFTHESGLTILLYPMAGFSSSYALFGTKYGSIDTTFKTQNDSEFTTVPEGIAHFLEHKLFESEDGDAFSLFAKTGASANAYTSFEKTCYLFSTTDNFDESLKALITFVQTPYFTKETVEKEQGIIGQEIKMYLDDPHWRVFFNLLTLMYEHNPVRIDIAGTVESIAKIDAELLYKCYHTFYNLNNMVVAVAGNFDAESAAKLIEDNLIAKEKIEITTKIPDESAEAFNKEFEQDLVVSMPLFNIGYKEKPVKEQNELETQLYYELIVSVIAGKGSELYKCLYEQGLINTTFGKEVFCGRGFLANIFAGESRQPRVVMEQIDSEIKKYKQSGISIGEFDRVKKAMYGRTIMNFNDVEEVANDLVSSHFSDNSIYDSIDIVAALSLDKANELLCASFNDQSRAISIINPIATDE